MIRKTVFRIVSVLIIALLFVGFASAADDYAMWKGDVTRSGYLTDDGPLTDTILWNNEYLPAGSSGMYPGVDASPVVADGCVYYSVWGDSKNQVNWIYCADAYTGEVKWKYKTETRGSFSLSNGILYAGTLGGQLIALDALTGSKKWITKQIASYSYVGLSGAPLVVGDIVYIVATTYDGSYTSYLYSFYADTGKVFISPISLQSSNGDGGIGKFASLCSNPGGTMIYAAGSGGIAAFDPIIREDIVWTFDSGARASSGIFVSTPVYSDGKLYLVKTPSSGNAVLYCVNAADGKEIWNINNEYIGSSSPAVTSDKIVVTGKSGLTVFDKSGNLLKHFQTGTTGFASPVVAGNTSYFGTSTEGTVYAVNINDGTLVWKCTLPKIAPTYYALIEASPAIYDGNLYIGSENAQMYAFGTTSGPIPSPTVTVAPTTPTPVPTSDIVETKNTVTDGTWSAVTKAEVVYEFDPSAANRISAPEITHGGKSIKIGMDAADSVVVQKKVDGVWSDVSALVDSSGSLVISGDISGAERLQATFTGRCLGDINGVNGVTSADSTNLIYYIARIITFTDIQMFYADVNGVNGVTSADSTNLIYYIARILNEFYK